MNHPVETFGFRFAHGGRTLAYTGDTGETEAVAGLADGADVFLSEAAFLDGPGLPPDLHLTARQAAGYASRAGVDGWSSPTCSPGTTRTRPARRRPRPSTAPSTWPSPDRSSTCPGPPLPRAGPGATPGEAHR